MRSVHGCIVSQDLSVLNLVIVKKGMHAFSHMLRYYSLWPFWNSGRKGPDMYAWRCIIDVCGLNKSRKMYEATVAHS
ncbi:hypothetical protein C5167_046192 [Papaver somniferum]|uniref:Uncharacterized protein n=1 Tax=Papaver somniferum TaxID=3469 RepID=A0A4Y7LDV1_PAPSO|nr:hypothetical protein C5167_046192 [Papaver somniferum]